MLMNGMRHRYEKCEPSNPTPLKIENKDEQQKKRVGSIIASALATEQLELVQTADKSFIPILDGHSDTAVAIDILENPPNPSSMGMSLELEGASEKSFG